MKKLGLLFLIGSMFFFVSCETEQYEENELDAINAKTSKADSKEESDEDGCETGFALCAADLTTCFIDDGFNRWGWTIGPMDSSKHNFGIFAGAGQCDVSKGVLAGTIDFEYDSQTGIANVNFIAEEGFVFKETHLYIGNDPYPMKIRGNGVEVPTVAPGQYPYKHGNLDNAVMDSYTIDGLSGEVYMIAHAVVCAKES